MIMRTYDSWSFFWPWHDEHAMYPYTYRTIGQLFFIACLYFLYLISMHPNLRKLYKQRVRKLGAPLRIEYRRKSRSLLRNVLEQNKETRSHSVFKNPVEYAPCRDLAYKRIEAYELVLITGAGGNAFVKRCYVWERCLSIMDNVATTL